MVLFDGGYTGGRIVLNQNGRLGPNAGTDFEDVLWLAESSAFMNVRPEMLGLMSQALCLRDRIAMYVAHVRRVACTIREARASVSWHL